MGNLPSIVGPIREVHLAPDDNPTSRSSFLIRDDASSISAAVFGRTTRLDSPVSLGPGSVWRQTTWEGGDGQYEWKDAQMYLEGNCDVWSRPGRIRMWPGWEFFEKFTDRQFDSWAMTAGGVANYFGISRFYYAERNMWLTTGPPSGGFRVYVYNGVTNTANHIPLTGGPSGTTAGGFRAVCPATEDGATAAFHYFAVGTQLWVWQHIGPGDNDGAWFRDTGAPALSIQWDSMIPFREGLYYCAGKSFYKRTPAAAYGIVGKHTRIAQHQAAIRTIGVTVWNNRLWYGVQYEGNRTMLAMSDGVSSQVVMEIPEPFILTRLVAHQGALYLFGGRPQAVPGTGNPPTPPSQGVVWRYTGSTLRKLWETDNEDREGLFDRRSHMINSACTLGSLLVWTTIGYRDSSVRSRPAIMMYDPEREAIFEGPPIPTDPTTAVGMTVTNVTTWNNTLVIGLRDHRNYQSVVNGLTWPTALAFWRWPKKVRNYHARKQRLFKGRSIEVAQPTQTQFLRSSRYHGVPDVRNELKQWISLRLRYRMPGKHTKFDVFVILDGEDRRKVGTVNYTPGAGKWSTITLPLKSGGKYLQSRFIQYELRLHNTDLRPHSTFTPEIADIELTWMPVTRLRLMWTFRFILQDDQPRLDGTANPLNTAAAQALVLLNMWQQGKPLRMWGPFASGEDTASISTSSGYHSVLIVPESLNISEYRVDTAGGNVMREVTLQLVKLPDEDW